MNTKKKDLIVLKGAATYGMIALKLDASMMIDAGESPFIEATTLKNTIAEQLLRTTNKKDKANFYILRELAIANPESVFLSERGEEKINLKFATSNLGGLVRNYKQHQVADLGTGELKSSKKNLGGAAEGEGLAKFKFEEEEDKVAAVAEVLNSSRITRVFYTGNWRTQMPDYNIEDLKIRCPRISFVELTQDEEKELASIAWDGAIEAMVAEGKRGDWYNDLHSNYNIRYHEHGNGSMQGDLVNADKSLSDLLKQDPLNEVSFETIVTLASTLAPSADLVSKAAVCLPTRISVIFCTGIDCSTDS